MAGMIKAIFAPHDGSRQRVLEATAAARNEAYGAMNRLEETVSDLLKRNDDLRFKRVKRNAEDQ